ncbi:hypothetical protein ACOMHN_011856 [Nucella lapillus]
MPLVCEDGRPYLTDPLTGRRLCACHLAHDGAPSHLHAHPGALSGGLKTLTGPPPGSPPGLFGMDLRGYGLRPEQLAQCLRPPGPPLGFDPAITAHPYGLLYAGLDVNGLGMRKAATRETTGPLKAWLHEHRKNPYPTKAEKIMLAIITKMTLTQVSTWFANARRRLKKESRLYSGGDNDNDDQDDKDDDPLDNDGTPNHSRDRCDSDEDINVDVSDVSETEDVTTTPTTPTTPSLTSPTTPFDPLSSKLSPHPSSLSSSSSSLSPFPSTSPFHPSFLPRPRPMGSDLSLCRVGVMGAGVPPSLRILTPHPSTLPAELLASAALKSSSSLCNGIATHCATLPVDSSAPKTSTAISNGSSSSPPPPSSLPRSSSSGRPPAGSSKPKIWSISQIIHSDRSPSPPAVAAVSGVSGSGGEDSPNGGCSGKAVVLLPQESSSSTVAAQTPDLLPLSPQQQELLSHRLTSSPFRTLESPEVRLASRQASAFLVPGHPHQGWGVSPVGALRLASACHVMNSAGGKGGGGEGGVEERGGSPGSEGNGSPQTEALDLHTKKEERDSGLVST